MQPGIHEFSKHPLQLFCALDFKIPSHPTSSPTPSPTLSDLTLLLPLGPQLRQLPLALCSPAPWPPQWPPLLSSDSSMLLPGFYFCFSLYLKCSFQDIYITPSSIFIRFLLKCQIISKAFPDHPSPPLCCHKPLFSCSHGCLSSYVCLYLCLSSPYSIVSSVRTLGSLLQHLEQCLTHRLNSTSIGSWRT